MNYSSLIVYAVISVVLLVVTLVFSCNLLKKGVAAKWLAFAGFFAIGCVVSYFARVLTGSLSVFAWTTSLHLLFIDAALFCFYKFTIYFMKKRKVYRRGLFEKVMVLLIALDAVSLLVNPFYNVALEFGFRDPVSSFSRIVYVAQHPLYYMHMALAYVMIFAILGAIWKFSKLAPKEFRKQYVYTEISLFLVLLLNALSVFALANQSYLNYSVTAYCLMSIIIYLFSYKYGNYIKLNYFKESVFENVNQAIVLFDYEDNLVMNNSKAVRRLLSVRFERNIRRKAFEKA